MNIVAAIAAVSKLISSVPPEVRQAVVNVFTDIVNGDSSNEMANKAKRAAIAIAAKQSYRRNR